MHQTRLKRCNQQLKDHSCRFSCHERTDRTTDRPHELHVYVGLAPIILFVVRRHELEAVLSVFHIIRLVNITFVLVVLSPVPSRAFLRGFLRFLETGQIFSICIKA